MAEVTRPLGDRVADAPRFVPRPRAADADRAPERSAADPGRPPEPLAEAASFPDRARWSWDAGGDLARLARSPADVPQAADPVDVATGDVLLFQDDASLPGVLPLIIGRAYRSSWRAGRWFGPSWASSFDDAHGDLLRQTAPDQVVTSYGYDPRGQLASVTGPLGAVTTVECDPAGLPVAVGDPRRRRHAVYPGPVRPGDGGYRTRGGVGTAPSWPRNPPARQSWVTGAA